MAINRKNFSKANLVDNEWRQGLVNLETISSNYNAVKNYYEQRKIAFLNYWKQKAQLEYQENIEKLFKYAAKATEIYYNNITKLWNQSYALSKQYDPTLTGDARHQNVKVIFAGKLRQLGYNYGSTLDEFINDQTNQKFYALMGFESEEIQARNLLKYASNIANNLVNPLFDNIKTTGKSGLNLRSWSGVTKRTDNSITPDTKADILIYPSSINITSDAEGNAAYSNGKTNLNMEILTYFDAQTNSGNYDEDTLMNAYLDYYNGEFAGVGGISQKTYRLQKTLENNWAKFAKSVELKEQLDNLYRKANYSTGYLTEDFVDLYTIYHISKQLMTLISPTTIAFFDQDSYLWISELLSQVFFTMAAVKGKEEKSQTRKEINKMTNKDERKAALQKYHRLKGKNLTYRWYRFTMDPKAEVRMYSQSRQNIDFRMRIMGVYEDKYGSVILNSEQKTIFS